jgi:hypothetical protein
LRISEAIHILNRAELPSDRDFPFEYTHISKEDAKELRRLNRANKPANNFLTKGDKNG